MKILCIHFKGGVGKSTTAIHVVGALLPTNESILLIDGDRQVTSYQFFNEGLPPSTYEPLQIDDQLSIVPLYPAKPINGALLGERINRIKKTPYTHLVVDTTPDPGLGAQIIAEVQPDLIIIPIKHDDRGGHIQLTPLLQTIGQLRAFDLEPQIKILPLGGAAENIMPYIDADLGLTYQIAQPIPANADLFGDAIYRDFDFAWNYEEQEFLYQMYQSLITEGVNE
jgi:chromosome partitioning protein